MSEPPEFSISRFGSIRTRLLLAFILIVSLPMLFLGAVLAVSVSRGVRSQTAAQLEAVASFKTAAVNACVKELKTELAHGLVDDDTISGMRTLVCGRPGSAEFLELHGKLTPRLRRWIAHTEFESISLIDLQGQVVLSTDKEREGRAFYDPALWRLGLSGPIARLSGDGQALIVIRPVVDRDGRVIAEIGGRAGMDRLDEIMRDPTGLGKTGRTYLVGEDFTLPGASSEQAGESRILSEGISAVLADRRQGSGDYRDFRGIPVHGVYRWLPEPGVALLTEQEQSESSLATREVLTVNAGVALAAVLFAAVASLAVTRGIARPIAELVETTALIGAGNLDLTARVERNDEIGVLANSFNLMTEQLRDIMDTLRDSEERYRKTFENAIEGVFRTSLKGRFLAANPALAHTLGYDSPSDLISSVTDISAQHYVNSTDREAFAREIISREAPVGREFRFYRKNGKQIWVFIKGRAVRDEDGAPLFFEGFLTDITEQKQAEEALRESERKFRAIFNQTFQLIWLLSLDGILLEANETALKFSGAEASRVFGKPFWEGPWWKHSAELRQKLRGAVRRAGEGEFVRFEVSHPAADGGMRHVDFSLKPVRDDEGNIILLISEGRDITERKKVEDALQESETRLSVIIDFLPDPMFAIDAEGKVIVWNRAIEEMTGVKSEDMLGKGNHEHSLPFYKRRRPILADLVLNPDPRIEKKYNFRRREKDVLTAEGPIPLGGGGMSVWAKAGPVYDSRGTVVGAIECIRDITIRVQAEREARAYAEELHSINRIALACTSSPELEIIMDRALHETLNIVGLEGGIICLLGPDRAMTLVAHRGVSEETVRGLSRDGVGAEEESVSDYCGLFSGPIILPGNWAVSKTNRDTSRDNEMGSRMIFPLKIQDRCLGMLCLFAREDPDPSQRVVDLLKTIAAQIALGMQNAVLYREVQRHAETLESKISERTAQLEAANRELESFSYSVSHDLRAPLRGIDGWSRALMEDCIDRLDEKGRGYLDRVRTETQRMGKLIDGLLELSRVVRKEMTRGPADLSALAESIASRLRETEPERVVEFVIEPGLRERCDARLAEILLANLLGNAWKFTSRHETARIEFGLIRTRMDGSATYFVRDDGAGFDMAYAKKLFGPFQRMHKSSEFAGSGIGLATVLRIVNRHGGRIWVESEVEKGTTFYFTL